MQVKLRDWQVGERCVHLELGDSFRRKLEHELIDKLKDFFPDAIVMSVNLEARACCVVKPGDEDHNVKTYTLTIDVPGKETIVKKPGEEGGHYLLKDILKEQAVRAVKDVQDECDAEVKKAPTDPEVAQWDAKDKPPEEKK